ncbi:hypothetical protein B0I37DRAFT_201327 [Chaetomium sp. MPI-CAGE-AT-0009]|nr:hypothetical protein B0I37DRAFT_201327 [Chaetomium sp. MPI-CAGE-AT-0009]
MLSWFLQELGVDVPVMKILGGVSVSHLADGVMQNLPSEMKNRIEGDGDTAQDPAGEVATQPSTTQRKSVVRYLGNT